MTAAYYSRNQSYSRSLNAEIAESEGRLPRLRAAKYLGVSAAAFDAGCKAAGYHATEWHHVGKYANEVYYYDCLELYESADFWRGAALAYKSAAKQAELLAMPAKIAAEQREARRAAFAATLKKNGDCTRHVARHDSRFAWQDRCAAAGISSTVPVGDLAAFRAAVAVVAAREAEKAARRAAIAADQAELRKLCDSRLTLRPDGCYAGHNICVKFLSSYQVNVYGRGVNLTTAEAMRHVVAALSE